MKIQVGLRLALMVTLASLLSMTSYSPRSRAAGALVGPCTFTVSGTTMTLDADCTTDSSIVIPDGFTLDGAGHTITAVDPMGGSFLGAIVKNGGSVAHVTDVTITTDGLTIACHPSSPVDTRLRGILFNGASGSITSNTVVDINQGASGCQEGNAIEVRNFGTSATRTHVTIDGNKVTGYQKTGIVVNGDADGTVTNNEVDGLGPVGYIARNGIQVGFGASGQVKRNIVRGNAYTDASAVSGGILVVGGEAYGGAVCVGVQIVQNTIEGNDVGVFISQYDDGWVAPSTATNIKVVNNIISNPAKTNGYTYQAGVSDVGNNDKIINNRISGAGYDPADACGCLFEVDADTSFTNRPKVHANK